MEIQKNKTKSIEFMINDEPIMKISEGKFFWKDQEIEDINEIYERFSAWLSFAEAERKVKSF